MSDEEFASHQIAKYRAHQLEDREALAWIDAGGRHFDQAPCSIRMVESTDKVRAERVAHIEMLEELVRLWSSPAVPWNSDGQSARSEAAGNNLP